MKHPHTLLIPLALVAGLAASSCAIANKAEISLSRHVSIGQELLDLQNARDAGAITDPEFVALKAKIMEMADSIDVVATINDHTPDGD